jgi:hypothetical protein
MSEEMFSKFLHGDLTIIIHNNKEYEDFVMMGNYHNLYWMNGEKVLLNNNPHLHLLTTYPFPIKRYPNGCRVMYIRSNEKCDFSLILKHSCHDYSAVNYIRGI